MTYYTRNHYAWQTYQRTQDPKLNFASKVFRDHVLTYVHPYKFLSKPTSFEIQWNLITPRVRNAVDRAFEQGVCPTAQGKAAYIYAAWCEANQWPTANISSWSNYGFTLQSNGCSFSTNEARKFVESGHYRSYSSNDSTYAEDIFKKLPALSSVLKKIQLMGAVAGGLHQHGARWDMSALRNVAKTGAFHEVWEALEVDYDSFKSPWKLEEEN